MSSTYPGKLHVLPLLGRAGVCNEGYVIKNLPYYIDKMQKIMGLNTSKFTNYLPESWSFLKTTWISLPPIIGILDNNKCLGCFKINQ